MATLGESDDIFGKWHRIFEGGAARSIGSRRIFGEDLPSIAPAEVGYGSHLV